MQEVPVELLTSTDDGPVWVETSFKFDTESDFRIDDNCLDMESSEISLKIQQYGELWAMLRAQQIRKDDGVKRIQAQIGQDLRSAAKVNGEKITEGAISEKVTINEAYQEAIADAANTRKHSLIAEAWWTAIKHKSEHIRSMAFIKNAELRNY